MMKSFAVGDIRVDRVIEREEPFLDIGTMFPTLPREELDRQRSWLEKIGALAPGTDNVTITVQSYLLRTPHHTILIDSCVGNDKQVDRLPQWNKQKSTTYMTALAAAGVSSDDIDFVACTHLHVDHVGWNTRLDNGRWVPTFPKARYLFAKTEYDHWEARSRTEPNPVFNESVLPVVEAGRADFVASDAALDDHVRLTPTPGHTPGHCAVLLGRGRDEAMVTGDLIHSPLQVSRPDISPAFDADAVQAADTRRRALERMHEGRMLCCTSHFPSPSVLRIGHDGRTFRCEPAS